MITKQVGLLFSAASVHVSVGLSVPKTVKSYLSDETDITIGNVQWQTLYKQSLDSDHLDL